jgi:hypothetical protein
VSRGQGNLFCLTVRFFLFAFLTFDLLVCRCFFVVSLLVVLDLLLLMAYWWCWIAVCAGHAVADG